MATAPPTSDTIPAAPTARSHAASAHQIIESKPNSLMANPPDSEPSGPHGPHATLPADEFYWASLEHTPHADRLVPATGRVRRRPSRRALKFQFEEVLPVPIESVACAFIHHPGFTIACGIDRSRLASIITPHTRTLTPSSIPTWIEGTTPATTQAAQIARSAAETRRLNVLTGSDEPTVVRRARTHLLLHAATALALLTAVLLVGVKRRIDHHTAGINESNARTAAAYARVLPPSPGGQPPAVRLASELRTLERVTARPGNRATGNPPSPTDTDFDASTTLASLLARLPDVPLLTDSLDILPARATLIVVVPTTRDAQSLAAAWDTPASLAHPWRLRQPQITAERAGDDEQSFRVTLTLEAAASATTPSSPRSPASTSARTPHP